MNDVSGFVRALPQEVILTGSGSFLKKSRKLQAGAISVIYEEGSLRTFSAGGAEFIRMIYPAIRDRNWLNIIPVISNENIRAGTDSFLVSYTAEYRNGSGIITAEYRFEGSSDNTLRAGMKARVASDFEKNRIGFCLLHPSEYSAGKKVRIIHYERNAEDSEFPVLISPHQPFSDIREILLKDGNTEFRIAFKGDIFEMEDQRNWTDASFKTYSTPLSIPFPVVLSTGTLIEQSITISASGVNRCCPSGTRPVSISVDTSTESNLPFIGTGATTRTLPLTNNEIEVIREIGFDHIRYDIYLFSENWKEKILIAIEESRKMKLNLEIALFADDNSDSEIRTFINLIKGAVPELAVISIYHRTIQCTPVTLAQKVIPLLREALPGCRICIGTNANFAQLNRARPAAGSHDLICYSIHPQEHASDNTTLIENLRAQADTVRSSKTFAGGKGIWISPVNIQRRFNANTSNFEIPEKHTMMPPQVDPRLMSLFGACWTAGTLKNLITEGVEGMTIYECIGERGFFQGDLPSGWPENFLSVPGMFFPSYFVIKFLLSDKTARIIGSRSSDPYSSEAIFLKDKSGLRGIIVNFCNSNSEVELENFNRQFLYLQMNCETYYSASENKKWLENSSTWKSMETNVLYQRPFSITLLKEAP